MNVTSITAVSCSVATLSSESLPNDGEKPNLSNSLLFSKYGYGKTTMKHVAFIALKRSGIYRSILEGWSFWEN